LSDFLGARRRAVSSSSSEANASSASLRAHAIADGEDHVEVVVVDRSSYLTASLGLNCQVLLDGCRGVQLALREDVLDVQTDILLRGLKQLRQENLCEPDSPAIKADLEAALPVLYLVEDDLGARGTTGLVHVHDFAISRRHAWYPD
jgi:hypothetical protein